MIAKHSSRFIFVGLICISFAAYAPGLSGFFLIDDNSYMTHLIDNADAYLQGHGLLEWLFTYYGIVFLRPFVQWLWLIDFAMWGRAPFGYHATNVLLHALSSFLVYVLTRFTTRQRWIGIIAGALFALHPYHAESVAWISDRTDVLSAFFYLLSATFFGLFRTRAKRLYLGVALIAMLCANLTKENTLALPAVLLVYDLLFHFPTLRWRIARAQIVMWSALAGYALIRFTFLAPPSLYQSTQSLDIVINLFAHYYTITFVQPFFADLSVEMYWTLLGVFALLALIYRRRKTVWLGIAWTIISLMPSLSVAYPAPRLAYTPSAGFVIALAAIVAQPFPQTMRGARVARFALSVFFIGAYAMGLNGRVENWATAGNIAGSVVQEMERLFPQIPPGTRFYFIGIPTMARGVPVILDDLNLKMALGISHRSAVDATLGAKFPIVDAPRANIFFIEYARRRLIEHPAVRDALSARAQCLGHARPAIEWTVAQGLREWATWNDLAEMDAPDDARGLRVLGNDPILASPPINMPALAIAAVEITLRARAATPTTRGELFWRATDQADFFPGISEAFPIQADGEWRTYRVNLGASGKLFFGDQIEQLRFDPTDAPAEIALKSIRVTSHCATSANNVCQCQP
ncbi:MAG: hypothetical protein HZC40_09880 [Chloroflexi bacterium]|nr:hypothetical protein [Chloroflexota bacterium]